MFFFKYDHRELDLLALRSIGVRNPLELEEVIEGYSVGTLEYADEVNKHIYYFIGFTKKSKPMEVAFYTTNDIDIITVGATIPPVERLSTIFADTVIQQFN
jgi:hypothetical protein